MAKVTIDLQEGFLHDKAIIYVDNKAVATIVDVTTRNQIGLAERVQFELQTSEAELKIELPNRNISQKQMIQAPSDIFIGVSLSGSKLSLNIQKREFWYA